jgi:hypothetical protein
MEDSVISYTHIANKMTYKFCSIIIFCSLLCIAFACKKSGVQEKEPNDDFLSANRIEQDTIVYGLLDNEQDRDFYRVDFSSPFIMDIELTSVKGVNHALKILKDDGQTILKYIDDSRKSSPERMCNMFFDVGTFYIEVLHGEKDTPQGNKSNKYELRLSTRTLDSEETEPNDYYESANLIEIGRDIKGYFCPSFNRLNQNAVSPFREEDWYYFNIEVGNDPILLDISLSGVPGVNSMLYLYDSERNEIAFADDRKQGDGERLEGIGITGSGKYYVMTASHFESNYEIPYTLSLATKAYDYLTEIEPNNNFKNANIILNKEISGKIFPGGDRDFYLFNSRSIEAINPVNPDEKYLYRIEASSESLDIILRIYNENMIKLIETDNIKGAGKEVIPDILLKNKFFIEVSAKKGEQTGYEYKLNVAYFPYSDSYEIEPNDVKESANKIKSDKITGYISKKNDKDFFLLTYKNRLRKKITLHGIKDAELKLSITDPLGFIIKSESLKGDGSISFNEMIDQKAYLIVESIIDNYDEPYTIDLGE